MISTDDKVLCIEELSYSYSQNEPPVLRNLNVSLHRTEILSIIGPSGCGKSTLLYLVAGLLEPDVGRVWWPRSEEFRASKLLLGPKLTIMFQKDTLLPWLNVEKNVGVGLKYVKSLDRKAKDDRVNELLDMAGLTAVRHAYPRHLSGGMKRRVALLASVAPMPQVLMLDEPFAALDEPTRIGLHKAVLDICHEMEISVILVTHDLAEAISLGDRVSILSNRPASIASTYEVPFSGERDMRALRQLDDFQDLYKLLWGELSKQIGTA